MRALHEFRMTKKINIEVLPVDKAVSTFNYLTSENRWVAGAFVPPYSLFLQESELDEIAAKGKNTFIVPRSYL